MKEAELVAAARAGDEDAFKELFESNLENIRRAARAILETDDLEDLEQDVAVDAWRGLKGFLEDSSFRTWITSITRNRCFAALRQRKRNDAHSANLSEEQEFSLWDRDTADLKPLSELERLMGGLSPQNRQLLEMNLEGLSEKEIADAIGLSLRTVRGRMRRAKVSMRKKRSESAEHLSSPRSLMGDSGVSRGEETMKTATPGKKGRRHLKTQVASAADLSSESLRQGHPDEVLPDGTEPGQDPTLEPFSFDDLVAEVEQLEYLAAIESRRQFDAEIVCEAERRLRSSILDLLDENGFDHRHEQEIFRRVVRAVWANTFMRDDLARLQQVRTGVHSREIRLWYFGAAAQSFLPDVVSEVLQEAKVKALESSPRGCE
jgi:RNA polymerase sigma factor (sigma-70 family)